MEEYEDTAFYLENDTFDPCGGHATTEGTYHYHSTAGCLQEQAGSKEGEHSALLGWAFVSFNPLLFSPQAPYDDFCLYCVVLCGAVLRRFLPSRRGEEYRVCARLRLVMGMARVYNRRLAQPSCQTPYHKQPTGTPTLTLSSCVPEAAVGWFVAQRLKAYVTMVLPPLATSAQDGFPIYGQLGPGGVEMKVGKLT